MSATHTPPADGRWPPEPGEQPRIFGGFTVAPPPADPGDFDVRSVWAQPHAEIPADVEVVVLPVGDAIEATVSAVSEHMGSKVIPSTLRRALARWALSAARRAAHEYRPAA
jgi:hypothetical protein